MGNVWNYSEHLLQSFIAAWVQLCHICVKNTQIATPQPKTTTNQLNSGWVGFIIGRNHCRRRHRRRRRRQGLYKKTAKKTQYNK